MPDYGVIVFLLFAFLLAGCVQTSHSPASNVSPTSISPATNSTSTTIVSAGQSIASAIPSIDDCKNMPSVDTRNYCFEQLAVATNDTSPCEFMGANPNGIMPTKDRDSCIEFIAQTSRNMDFCSKISVAEVTGESGSGRIGCYSIFFTHGITNASACSNVPVSETALEETGPIPPATGPPEYTNVTYFLRDECLFGVAVNTRDQLACQKIINETIRQSCIGHFNSTTIPTMTVTTTMTPSTTLPAIPQGSTGQTLLGPNGLKVTLLKVIWSQCQIFSGSPPEQCLRATVKLENSGSNLLYDVVINANLEDGLGNVLYKGPCSVSDGGLPIDINSSSPSIDINPGEVLTGDACFEGVSSDAKSFKLVLAGNPSPETNLATDAVLANYNYTFSTDQIGTS